uniref:Uncharacterized protein n=1 Tax=Mycena chlorophos TaxID=658473 RepID=A0ABQ0M048_MYCCL|nr:predicted protein [Mycena chlorophos]
MASASSPSQAPSKTSERQSYASLTDEKPGLVAGGRRVRSCSGGHGSQRVSTAAATRVRGWCSRRNPSMVGRRGRKTRRTFCTDAAAGWKNRARWAARPTGAPPSSPSRDVLRELRIEDVWLEEREKRCMVPGARRHNRLRRRGKSGRLLVRRQRSLSLGERKTLAAHLLRQARKDDGPRLRLRHSLQVPRCTGPVRALGHHGKKISRGTGYARFGPSVLRSRARTPHWPRRPDPSREELALNVAGRFRVAFPRFHLHSVALRIRQLPINPCLFILFSTQIICDSPGAPYLGFPIRDSSNRASPIRSKIAWLVGKSTRPSARHASSGSRLSPSGSLRARTMSGAACPRRGSFAPPLRGAWVTLSAVAWALLAHRRG